MRVKKKFVAEIAVEDLIKSYGIESSFRGYWGKVNLFKKDGLPIDKVFLIAEGVKDSSNTDESFQLDLPQENDDKSYSIGDVIKTSFTNSRGIDIDTYGVYLGDRDDEFLLVCYYDSEVYDWKVDITHKDSASYCTEEDLNKFFSQL